MCTLHLYQYTFLTVYKDTIVCLSLSHLCASVLIKMISLARKSSGPLVFTGDGSLKTSNIKAELSLCAEALWKLCTQLLQGKLRWYVASWQGNYWFSTEEWIIRHTALYFFGLSPYLSSSLSRSWLQRPGLGGTGSAGSSGLWGRKWRSWWVRDGDYEQTNSATLWSTRVEPFNFIVCANVFITNPSVKPRRSSVIGTQLLIAGAGSSSTLQGEKYMLLQQVWQESSFNQVLFGTPSSIRLLNRMKLSCALLLLFFNHFEVNTMAVSPYLVLAKPGMTRMRKLLGLYLFPVVWLSAEPPSSFASAGSSSLELKGK